MSAEQNKAAIQRFIERFNQGDIGAVDDFVTEHVVYHNAPPGLAAGIEGYRQLIGMWLTAFPGVRVTVDDLISEGEQVVARLTVRGSHGGDLMGMAPTGKSVEVGVITIMRFEDGKLAEEWEQVDMLGMLQQLGAMPAPAPATA